MFELKESGARLAVALAPLSPESLTDVELRDVVRGFESLTGWAQAGQLAVLAEIARREADEVPELVFASVADHNPDRFVADEIAVELSITKLAASIRVGLASDLTSFPETWQALRGGCLDLAKVREIVDQLSLMDSPEFVVALETAAIEYGRTHTRPQLRQWLRKRVIAFEPAVAETRRKTAEQGRRVAHYPGLDGMGTILAELPAQDAVAVWRMVDQVAQASRFDAAAAKSAGSEPSDGRSIDQRRADAFRDLILDRVPARARAEVLVTVSAETLAGLSEEPGELAGFGPITAEHARELAKDATWRRLLTDPESGRLIEVGRDSYRPGRVLTRTVQARDLTCRFPGCRRAVSGCDLDHTIPWPKGKTEEANLAGLCRSHHLLKTHGNWHVEQLPGAILRWTTPTGRRFDTHPADHRPTGFSLGGVNTNGDPPGVAA